LTDRSNIAKVGYRLADPISTLRRLDREIRIAGERAIHTDQFKNTLANVGLDLAYLDQPDFIKFWDEDAARIETVVQQIGRAHWSSAKLEQLMMNAIGCLRGDRTWPGRTR
jgi:hypothetical protein